jgi:twitching motility two-component system response regulator PilH
MRHASPLEPLCRKEAVMQIRNVLIVEDSPTDSKLLCDMLTKNGFGVVAVGSAEEALARVKQNKPDLVLMDVVLPGQNGFQATRTLSRDDATKDVPVIICSSKGQATDKVWGLRQGAKNYLVKPVKQTELLAMIAALGQG